MKSTSFKDSFALLHFYFRTWWDESNQQDKLVTAALTFFTVALIISWYTWVIKRSSKGKLPSPPGPRALPLVGNILSLDPELHTYFAELAKTYGPIYKLQLGKKVGIVISSPSLAREVLKDHDTTFANRDVPAAGKATTYGGRDLVFSQYGPEWRMLRKVCVREMLGNASLNAVHGLRLREVRRMVGRVHSRVGSPVNVGEEMFLTAMNVITSMMWGGAAKGDEGTTTFGVEFRQVIGEMSDLLGKPNISDFYPSLDRFDLQGFRGKMKVIFERFDGMFDSIIAQRLKIDDRERRETKDFLQLMLQLQEEDDSETPFTMIHLKALLMDIVTSGTETTSNTVEWAVAELMNKPETMKKAQEELEIVVGKDNMVEESHLPKLDYLQLVMKEVLRLHPALPLLVPHCPSSSSAVGGYMIPKGCRVLVNVWAIHRDPTIWINPSEFNPERFSNGKWDYSGSDFNYFPFGSGRRICVGIAMAEKMFMYELATLLHSFDWKLKEGDKMDLKEKFGIVLKKATPLVAVPTPRLSDPALYA